MPVELGVGIRLLAGLRMISLLVCVRNDSEALVGELLKLFVLDDDSTDRHYLSVVVSRQLLASLSRLPLLSFSSPFRHPPFGSFSVGPY